ncbi:MAG: PAS domain S-box protein [Syntrophobacteraceae bacterium]
MRNHNTFEDAEEIRVCRGDIDYQGIVKHINDGVVIIREGIIVFANDAFCAIAQKKREGIVGSDFSRFIALADREKVIRYLTERLFTEGLSDRIEFVMLREEGDAIIEMKVSVVECEGAPAILGALTDISQRRRTRIELQRIKERLESILHSMNEVVVSMSPNGYWILSINPAAEALYGVPLRDFTSGENHILSFVHPDDIGKVKQFYNNLLEMEFDEAQYRVISSNRRTKWVIDEGHVVYSSKGTIRRIDHVIRDITEKKKAIDALRQSEAKYKDFFESTSDMAFAITPEGVFIDINEAGLNLLGFESKEEALASNVKDFYVDLAEREQLIEEIYGKGYVEGRHVKFKNKAGEPIEVAITSRVKVDENGRILYHEGIVHNITQALDDQRNRVLRNAAGGLCHYLNTHLMNLGGSKDALAEELNTLEALVDRFVQGETGDGVVEEMKSLMADMLYFHKEIAHAYRKISEVTKAFNKAFLYKEEAYSTSTILDIFKSYGYDADE